MSTASAREPIAPPPSSEIQGLCSSESRATGSRRSDPSVATGHDAVLAEISAGIIHDFRNVLAVIEAGVSVAQRHSDDPDQVRMCLAGIHDGVLRGLELASRLLRVADNDDPDPKPRDLNELLERLRVFLQYGAGPDVQIVFDLAPSLPRCMVDAAQFNAAILNLVVNARDAMPRGGIINIRTSRTIEVERDAHSPTTFICLRVRDSGKGMSPAVLRQVFDPYFTTKGQAGSGLGLPQVCAFIKRTGGRINVRSATGSGSTFELLFPAQPSPIPAGNRVGRQLDRWINEGGADEETSGDTTGQTHPRSSASQ